MSFIARPKVMQLALPSNELLALRDYEVACPRCALAAAMIRSAPPLRRRFSSCRSPHTGRPNCQASVVHPKHPLISCSNRTA